MAEVQFIEDCLTQFRELIELVPTYILQTEQDSTKHKKRKKHSLVDLKNRFDNKVKKLETHRSNV